MGDDPLPTEISLVSLAEKFHQPFEYFLTLDYQFVKKLFIILKEESDALNKD
jgi:hypothetical protein